MNGDEREDRLIALLNDFIMRINTNDKVQRLIRKWNTEILFWGRDIGYGFIINVHDGMANFNGISNNQDEGKVKVVADRSTLESMFLGKENIAHLYLDGVVETYGSEKDQIIMDAIARLLWK